MIQKKKEYFFIQNTFLNIKCHQKIEKKFSFGMFQLKRPFEYKHNIKILTRKTANEKPFFPLLIEQTEFEMVIFFMIVVI